MGVVLFGVGKGGTGKSTLTQNVAAVRASLKYRTAIIDLDWRQTTTGKWGIDRQNDAALAPIHIALLPKRIKPDEDADIQFFGERLQRMLGEYDDIFIEVGGQDSKLFRAAMTVSDKIIAPLVPSPADINTVPDLAELVRSFKKKPNISVVLNMANESPRLTRDTLNVMAEYADALAVFKTQIGKRVAFKYAMAAGRAAHEIPTKREGFDAAAAHEVKDLYLEIFGK